jgi:molecular chaperone GrpE
VTERPREEASYAGHPAYDADSGDGGPVEAAEVPVTRVEGMEREAAGTGPDADDVDAVNTEAVNDDAPPPPSAAPQDQENGGADVDAESVLSAVEPHPDTALAAERLADLQRLQAEYVNYKRRVDRDRALVQERVVRDVLESVLPVLDDIQAARDHGDLTEGPFAAIADKLEATLGKYGLQRFGTKGEQFDPMQHEALMHAPWPTDDAELPGGVTATTVVTVLQPGYRAGEQVLRPARVAVADPA